MNLSGDHILLANERLGLTAFYIDQSGINILDNYSLNINTVRLSKGKDNIVFCANGDGGVEALQFNGASFEKIDKTAIGDDVNDVSVSSDNKFVSIASLNNGLKVYRFNNNKFEFIYQKCYYNNSYPIDSYGSAWTAGYSTQVIDNKIYYGSASVFISWAKAVYRLDEIFVESYDTNGVLLSRPHEQHGGWGIPNRINQGINNQIFISFSNNGVRELSQNSSINNGGVAHEVDVSTNNVIYLANGTGGLRSYAYSDEFYQLAHTNEGGEALGIESIGRDLVFLANGADGLRVYTHHDSCFTNQAHINTEGQCMDVIILDDSTIVVADGYNGIKAYSYNGWGYRFIPQNFDLIHNYPNPFNPITTLSYELPEQTDVQMTIYDISGRKINQWTYQNQQAGAYDITWNGTNQYGNPVPSGVYIYRMVAGEFVESKKMVFLK